MLKALVALGGDAVPRESLLLALWPGPDADGSKNFDVTVLRLRKLLDVEGALLLSDGKLSLNRRWVWWDVQVFEQRFAVLIPALRGGAPEPAIQALAAALKCVGIRLAPDRARFRSRRVPAERVPRAPPAGADSR